MPDYNLGRAEGKIVITAETSGATRELGQYETATKRVTEAVKDQSRVEQELSKRRQEAEQAISRRKQAEAEYQKINKDSKSTVEEQIGAELNRTRTRDDAERATRRLIEVERAYSASVKGNTAEVRKFINAIDDTGGAHDRATRKARDFRNEINETDRTIRVLSNTLTSTLGTALKSLAIGGGVGAAGGAAGLLGAGGVQGILAATEAVKDFSGAALLMPAVVGGAAVVVGTLAVAFNGVGDALKAMDDPQKFTEAIQKLAPAAAQAVTVIASFRDAFKGAMAAIQQSFFQPFVNQIQPLIITWLPQLMRAGQAVADVLGRAGSVIATWLQTPQTMQAFHTFITNLVTSLNQMLPAITPVLNAFTQLAVVGSTFFPQIAQSIARIATEFNAWVQTASANGSLQAWIQTALTSFGELARSIHNVLDAASNIGRAFQASGSQGFLEWLVSITQEFKNWTESAKGASVLTDFFATMHQASVILGPILRIIGEAVLQLLTNLAKLGIQMGPGITSFFQSLSEALNTLGQALIAAGPGLGEILSGLGRALLQIVQQVGPALPNLFASLARTLIELTPAAVAVAQAIAQIMAHITPTEIEMIIGIVAAFQGLSVVIPIIQGVAAALAFLAANPIALAVAALALLVGGIIYAYNNSETFRNTIKGLWKDLQDIGSWIGNIFVTVWHTLGDAIKTAFAGLDTLADQMSTAVTNAWNVVTNSVGQWFQDAYDWGRNIVSRLIAGLSDMFAPLSDAWDRLVGGAIDDKNPHSPPKKGPLSGDGDPTAAGQRVSEQFASGVSAGAPAVSSAYDAVIGGEKGTGPGGAAGGGGGASGFSTAGLSTGATGALGANAAKSGAGHSGFDQFVNTIAQDLQGWLNFVQHSYELFTKVTDTIVQTTKVVASLWGGGDNPMTRPGGIFSKSPGLTPAQQSIPGIENMPQAKGKAPLPNLVPKPPAGAPPVPQQSVPGVPQGPGAPAAPPATAPPVAPGPGSAGAPAGASTVPITVNADGTISSPNPEWQKLLTRESGGRNVLQGDIPGDPNTGPNKAQGYFQITPDTWKGNGGLEFAPSPMEASPQQQAIVAARIFNARGGQPWGAVPGGGRENEDLLRSGLGTVPPPAPPGAGPIGAPQAPGKPPAAPPHGQGEGGQASPFGNLTPDQVGVASSGVGFTGLLGVLKYTLSQSPSALADAALAADAATPAAISGLTVDASAGAAGAAATAGGIGVGAGAGVVAAGVGGLYAGATAFGSASGQEGSVDYTKGKFIKTADGKMVMIPPGADPKAMMDRFPGGTLLDADQKPVQPNAASPRLRPGETLIAPGVVAGGGGPAGPAYTRRLDQPEVALRDQSTPLVPGRGVGGLTGDITPGGGGPPAGPPGRAPSFGPYGVPESQVKGIIPVQDPHLQALGRFWGMQGSTYPGHQVVGSENEGIDWGAFPGWTNRPGTAYGGAVGGQIGTEQGGSRQLTREEADRSTAYAKWVGTQPGVEQVINMNPYTGEKVGYYNGRPVGPDMPGTTDPGYYRDDWTGHSQHVHTRFTKSLGAPDGSVGVPQGPAPPAPTTAGAPAPQTGPAPKIQGSTEWSTVPPGWDISQPIPGDVRKAHGIPDSVPPLYYSAAPGSVTNVAAPPGTPQSQMTPGGTISTPLPGQQQGFPGQGTADTKSPMDSFTQGMQGFSSIAGDAFKIFGDVITNIKAAATMTDQLVRGFANTEDINKFIDQIQTFIQTGADIAHLVGDVGGMVGGASGGMDFGAGGAIQAAAGIVQSALEATNMAIDLGQEAWHQVTKYGAIFAGMLLGNADTGPLGGNVRMLLNTNTGQLQAYSEDNPQNKATHNLGWLARSYGGPNPNAQPNVQQNQVNIYAGPGQSPRNMMDESMWLVSTGAPSVMSAAGQE